MVRNDDSANTGGQHMNTELPPLDQIVKTLKQLEKSIEANDSSHLEGIEELYMLCTMYSKGYILKLRAMK